LRAIPDASASCRDTGEPGGEAEGEEGNEAEGGEEAVKSWRAAFLVLWAVYATVIVAVYLMGSGRLAVSATAPGWLVAVTILRSISFFPYFGPRTTDLLFLVLSAGINVVLLFSPVAVIAMLRKRRRRKPMDMGL
jgi:uncharacterized membrane protein YoaK (UPF0700 family)